MQRKAMAEQANVKTSARVSRATDGFLDDHPTRTAKADVLILFEHIGYTLDTSLESEDARSEMRRLMEVHQLQVDAHSAVADFDRLRDDLVALSLLARQNSQVPVDEAMSLANPAQPHGSPTEVS
jgi:hypothetical protein